MKSKLATLSAILILSIGLSTSNFGASSAQDAAEPVVTTEGDLCPTEIIDEMVRIKTDFYVNLEAQLESPDLTSERLYDLYEDYQEVIDDIADASKRRTLQFGDLEENPDISTSCRDARVSEINEVQDIFTQYVSQVTARKRNYVLIEKYDHINQGLQEIQEALADIQSGFDTFDNQLPCFVEECVTR